MKKIAVFILLLAGLALLGFFFSKKACRMVCAPSASSLAAYPNAGVAALEQSFQAEAQDLCMQMCRARAEILTLLGQDAPDQALIDRRSEEIGALQARLEKRIARHVADVRKALPPEQGKAYMAGVQKKFSSCVSNPS